MCKPGIIYVSNRADGLRFLELRSMPALSRKDPFRALIKKTEPMKTIEDLAG